jgi:hypothetical protein
MIGTIRKHQTWLWAIIIAVVIITFVFFFSPYAKMNDSRRGRVNYGSINGEQISEDQFANAWKEVQLRYFFMNGNWPSEEAKKSGFDPERETYQWLLLEQKADQMGIHVGPREVARVAQAMLSQVMRSGSGINSPDAFIRQVLNPRGFQADDLERFVRHYLTVQELIGTVGLSGKLVTPEEAKSLYDREHQEMATEVVFFSPSNYVASVSASPDAISQFYSNRLAFYRIPDRIQVSYVKFGISNFLAQAEAELMKTNLTEMVDAALQRIGTNYLRLAKSPEEAKVKIREEMIREVALSKARRKAAEFATPLFDIDPVSADNLEKLAKTNGLTVGVTAPFDRETGPQDLDVNMDFAQRAFSRTPTDPFAGPLASQNAVYVIALDKKIPSEIPPLDRIRERVTEDFKYNQALNQARQAGASFYPVLTNELAQGKSFASICLNSKFKPIPLPPFSLSTQDLPDIEGRVSLNQVKQLAFSTPVGKPSNFQPTPDGGLILFVKTKLPLDQARMSAELPAFVNRLRMSRENEAFNEWFRKEAERGLRDTPALRQQPPPPALAPGTGQKKS